MREKKQGTRRTAAWMAILLMISALCGCSGRSSEGGQTEKLHLPETVTSLAEAPAIVGSPMALGRQDSDPLILFSQKLFATSLENAREAGVENPVLSPVSVYLAMMITACSDNSLNEEQIAECEALFGVSQEQWDQWGAKLMRHLNWAKDGSCVSAANSLWLDTDMTLDENTLQRISQHLHTDVYQGDLQSTGIVEAVNAWVNHETHDLIPQFRQDPYDEMTVLSILNAVYLEAKWQQVFKEGQVEEKSFYTAQNEEVVAAFLTDTLCYRAYVQRDDWDGVVLPYRDGNLAFVALRPMAGQTADELLWSLEPQDWGQCSDLAADTLMNFSMPKFTVEYRQDLTELLSEMGLPHVVSDGGIGIGQTVKIQVDEDGTKAAAVTEVTAGGAMELPEEDPLEIHFDQPFVYAVLDTASRIPLFIGVMDRPVR